MLFGGCSCLPTTLSMSRRGLLCAGGAGFVTALIGTLASSSRIARAQALASKPPEVDGLAVRIVTDNQIIKWTPTEKRDGLTIERRPGGNLSPDAPPSVDLVAEWGLSMHAESRRGQRGRSIECDCIRSDSPRHDLCGQRQWRRLEERRCGQFMVSGER